MVYHSDASKFGLGGYNVISGIAWRLELPITCRLRTSLNSLEFLDCVISIWMNHFYQVIESESCLLSQMDSTTAMGWLKKSNFANKLDKKVQLATARKLTDLILDTESCLYSHKLHCRLPSRDFHINDTHLCNLLLSHFPDHAPFGLTILPVLPDIVSLLTFLLLNQHLMEPWLKAPMQRNFALGLGSNVISLPLDYTLTPTLTVSPSFRDQRSSAPSLTPSEKVDLVMEKMVKPSSQTQLDPPWIAYQRPLSWLTDLTQAWTEMGILHYFYRDNLEDTAP
jgi:hypothetical protein